MNLRREPALIIELLKALVIVLSVSVVPGLDRDVQNVIILVATGVAGVLTAVFTRPLELPLLAEGIKTLAVALAAFGLNLNPELLATAVITFGAVLTAAERSQLTPVKSPKG